MRALVTIGAGPRGEYACRALVITAMHEDGTTTGEHTATVAAALERELNAGNMRVLTEWAAWRYLNALEVTDAAALLERAGVEL